MAQAEVIGERRPGAARRRERPAAPARALCVDLDGTLLRTDLLAESLLLLLRRNLLYLFLLPLWLLKGKARLKAEIARRVEIEPELLPYSEEFLAFLRREKARGRRLVLATAADGKPARAIAAHLGLFDAVLASDGRANLSGAAKLRRLEAECGRGDFDYAGNARADIALFRAAGGAVLVNPAAGVRAGARKAGADILAEFGERPFRPRAYAKALRPHQWLKNALVLLPLLLAHKVLDAAALQQAGLAFLAFCLCASSVYVLNDLLDLADDRRHAEKRTRPFAAGTVPLAHGLVMAPLLLAAAAAACLLLPPAFAAVLAAYYALTLGYSFFFKRTLLFDVIVLAALYTSRIVAGSAALAIERSPWLLTFSVFLFFSLALVKRYVELGEGEDEAAPLARRARGYRGVDRETLSQFGVTSGLLSVLVLALYIDSDNVRRLYAHPEVIWFLCPLVLYLVSRIWVLARRGEMPGDPVLFAATDWRSQAVVGLGAALMMAAAL